ncbi:hypothetical protein Pcinc_002834 [Petrolisthes cinctipes]|uniref:ABC transmembrane type-1 domain-containing protein n=1 Tax=Petrolisthes cinctipes TaxID=88211 RepID=A0AAE1GK91_PETCI|nr:hypothetical protein Pcinc_002834 [Petrolisthes cinctipes]
MVFNTARTTKETQGDIMMTGGHLLATVDTPKLSLQLWIFQLVFGMSFVVVLVTGIIQSFALKVWIMRQSANLHNTMLNKTIRAPLYFFKAINPARILSRFGQDIDEFDIQVPYHLGFVLEGGLMLVIKVCLVCSIYVWYTTPAIVITGLLILVDAFVNGGGRELKHYHSINKTQVIEHVSTTLSGLSVIRLFNKERLFIHRMYQMLDQHSSTHLLYRLSHHCVGCGVSLLCVVAVITLNAMCVFNKGIVSTASAGLAIVTLNGVCTYLPLLLKIKSDFYSHTTSVQRIIHFIGNVEDECSKDLPLSDNNQSPTQEQQEDRDEHKPIRGAIEFRDVKLRRYQREGPPGLVLCADIRAGERIAVVGMSGEERYSFLDALLRFYELDTGNILVDGVDVSTLQLHTLRSIICVIPRELVLFEGTLR